MATTLTADQPMPLEELAPDWPNDEAPLTFWENVAQSRWGQYITAIERRALLDVHARFERPGVGLEVGCEGGRWCRLMTDLGWQMIATDVNLRALQLCQRRNPNVRCIHVEANDETIPVDSTSVDLLLGIEVPIVERDWFLGEARRVLKSGGILIGTTNNLMSWRGIAANIKSKLTGKPMFYDTAYHSFRRNLRRSFELCKELGCCWAPFGRHSDSRFVPVATALEQHLGLRRLALISPWILFTAIRK